MTPEEILRQLELNLRREDRDVEGYLKELLLYLQEQTLALLSELPPQSSLTQRQVLRVLGGVESSLYADGSLDSIVESVRELFDLQEQVIRRLFEQATGKEPPKRLSAEFRESLFIFASSREQLVRDAIGRYAGTIREGLLDNVLARRGLVIGDLAKSAADTFQRLLRTELISSISAHNQALMMELAIKAGIPFVLYAGPKDERNRPFCAARAQKVFPIKEVFTWENNNREPAWIYGGGWGCRHLLVPVMTQ